MTTTGPVGVQAQVTGKVSGQLSVGNNIITEYVSCGVEFCSGSVTVTNNGPTTATNVRLTFDPSSDMTNQGDTRCSAGVCKLGTLAPGATATVQVLSGAANPPVASVTSDQNDFSNGNNSVALGPQSGA